MHPRVAAAVLPAPLDVFKVLLVSIGYPPRRLLRYMWDVRPDHVTSRDQRLVPRSPRLMPSPPLKGGSLVPRSLSLHLACAKADPSPSENADIDSPSLDSRHTLSCATSSRPSARNCSPNTHRRSRPVVLSVLLALRDPLNTSATTTIWFQPKLNPSVSWHTRRRSLLYVPMLGPLDADAKCHGGA